MSLEKDMLEVQDILGEFDRQIALTFQRAIKAKPRRLETILEAAKRVDELLQAADIWKRYAHRISAYSKGAEKPAPTKPERANAY